MFRGLIELLSFLSYIDFANILEISGEERIKQNKQNYSYQKTKTLYQNPHFYSQKSYHNKTIPRNKTSNISLYGKRQKMENKRKSIEKKFKLEKRELIIKKTLKNNP
ncbi:MAG: hypothetical protein KC516_00845 [Nanoarchaeota archaeon]|nr:hypothetical protein [Nanoarchaeota archaeon]